MKRVLSRAVLARHMIKTVVKVIENFDNCPDNCNVFQLDGDGIGAVCDASPGCGGCGQPACEQIIPIIEIIE
jgi:hypothetical protein